jgi:hypothetical protein
MKVNNTPNITKYWGSFTNLEKVIKLAHKKAGRVLIEADFRIGLPLPLYQC